MPPDISHNHGMPFGLFAALLAFTSSAALADPCEAPLPNRVGQVFSGSVRYVGDGDSLCVGAGADPNGWIEVRIADFDAPELHAPLGRRSKLMLEQIAMGQPVVCAAARGRSGRVIVFDRVIAICRINGRSIAELLRASGAPEGGR
ncbi:MAG: nuclease [Hyphomicrobium sp.]